jgi:hypothetical protein
MNKTPNLRALAGSMLAAGLLAGCAATGKPPEEAVLERAQERLDLVLSEDYAAAYEFLSPGYRSSVTLAAYQRDMVMRRLRWTDARAVGSECSEDVCKVRISMDFVVVGALPGVSRYETKGGGEENWIRTDGQWYYLPKD